MAQRIPKALRLTEQLFFRTTAHERRKFERLVRRQPHRSMSRLLRELVQKACERQE